MSIRPGGGLTVLLGILRGLQTAATSDSRITVVCSAEGTRVEIEKQGIAIAKQPLVDAAGIKRQLWVTMKMSSYVESIRGEGPAIFLSINQFVPRIKCPQVVYHINLLRFMPIDKSANLKTKAFEWLRNYSAKQALKHAAANVYESAFIKECAEGVFANSNPNDRVIYIGLPDNLANAKHSDSVSNFDPAQIFSITNGNPHKDNGTLVRTVAELCKLEPNVDWKLKIAGGLFPELWEPYKSLARDLGVIENIEWVGFMNQDQLTEHLNKSLCLISTSRVESFCMVACESMGRGCPPIVADCAAMPESVGSAGVLAPAGDHEAFAKAIIQFHKNPDLRADYVTRGFDHIKSFRWDVCGQQFTELFQSITK